MKLNSEILLNLLGVELCCKETRPGVFVFYFLGDSESSEEYDFNGLTEDKLIRQLGRLKRKLTRYK